MYLFSWIKRFARVECRLNRVASFLCPVNDFFESQDVGGFGDLMIVEVDSFIGSRFLQ